MKHAWRYTPGLPADVDACVCGLQRRHLGGGNGRRSTEYRSVGGEWVTVLPACTRQPGQSGQEERSAGR